MQQPIEGADPERRRNAEIVSESVRRDEFLPRVFRALRLLLLDGRNSGDDVAQMLSMHRRTLNRRLKELGTTFQQALDEVRYSVARQHLATSEISLDDVAATLGYAGVSPFMRSFQRWAGTTPGRWRRTAAASGAFANAARTMHDLHVHFATDPAAFARRGSIVDGATRARRA
jgi:AraC-like DNA-binding protein